ncbi:MAG: hypothetical protein U1E31_02720 [Rickettsiales bacterium]
MQKNKTEINELINNINKLILYKKNFNEIEIIYLDKKCKTFLGRIKIIFLKLQKYFS